MNKTYAVMAVAVLLVLVCAAVVLGNTEGNKIIPSDYSNEDNWMEIPDSIVYDADVVYLYPTAFSPSYEGEKCTIDNESMREEAQAIYEQQATAFEGTANIYAPYYRQVDASSLAGLTQPEMVEREMGEPKADVYAALDYYFENYNEGRPFILAGHSQGSMMIYIVLDDYMEQHPDIYSRMIASYMLGNAATKEWLAANTHVKMATGAGDTGVLVSWNSEGPGNIGKYNMVVPENSVCINPLNWTTDGTYASVSENRGCLSEVDGEYVIVEGFADAMVDVDRGSVIVYSVDPEVYAMPEESEAQFGPESYHGCDYAFFYVNIHENAELRIANYLAENA